jgi:hypothetical protein
MSPIIITKIPSPGVAESTFTVSEKDSIYLATKADAMKFTIRRNRDVHK